MQKATTNQIEFLSEYLDASHFSDKEHFRMFQDYIGKKYAGQNLDLIMAFPSRDYRLADELPNILFPGVPVVFVAAVNEMEVPRRTSASSESPGSCSGSIFAARWDSSCACNRTRGAWS